MLKLNAVAAVPLVMLSCLGGAFAETGRTQPTGGETAAAPSGPEDDLRRRVARAIDRDDPEARDALLGALDAALANGPRGRADLLVLRAALLGSGHDFAKAEADLDAALALSPNNPQARLSRAYLYATTGDDAAARADCANLAPRHAALARIACEARIMSLTGEAEAALALLDGALARPGAAPPLRAHLDAMRAEILERLGRTSAAGWAHLAAISARPEATGLRLDYAAFLLRQGAADRAHALAEDGGSTKARMIAARALRILGRPDPAQEAELKARIAPHQTAGPDHHAHEQAEFALWIAGDAKAALAHAEANWRQQKEPGDLLLLLEAARAAGRPEAAAPALAWARARGLEDIRLPRSAATPARLSTQGD